MNFKCASKSWEKSVTSVVCAQNNTIAKFATLIEGYFSNDIKWLLKCFKIPSLDMWVNFGLVKILCKKSQIATHRQSSHKPIYL